MKLTKRQLMNILIEEVGLSDNQVKRINLKRQFFPAVERLIDKAVGRIDDEIDAYERLTKVDILDVLVPYLVNLNRQLSGFNESKITRKQLRRLIIKEFLDGRKMDAYSDSHLEYFGDFTNLLVAMINESEMDCIYFRVPDYPDWGRTRRNINENFPEYL